MEEFDEMEDGADKRQNLSFYLTMMGAADLRSFVCIALKEAMTDELVDQFTWTGHGTTRTLNASKIMFAIYQAASGFFKNTEPTQRLPTFAVHAQAVIKAVKQRFRNKSKNIKTKEANDSKDRKKGEVSNRGAADPKSDGEEYYADSEKEKVEDKAEDDNDLTENETDEEEDVYDGTEDEDDY